MRTRPISGIHGILILTSLSAVAAAAEDPTARLGGTNRILQEDAEDWIVRGNYCGNGRKGRFVPGDRFSTSLAGSVAFDGAGNGYVAAGTFIAVVPKEGPVEVLTGQPGFSGHSDGPPGRATFGNALDIACAGEGLLYVADAANFTLRRIRRKAGVWHTETVAGVPGVEGRRDGPGHQALLQSVFDSVTVDDKGTVYLFSGSFIRKYENGMVSTLNDRGGNGYVNGPLRDARFRHGQGRFHGLTCDSRGNLYVADKVNIAIRKIDLTKGVVSTFAGRGPDEPRVQPRDGPALEARFNEGGGPNVIYYDRVHDRFVVRSDDERASRVIYRREGQWVVHTLGARLAFDDGERRLVALARYPCGVDHAGRIYLLGRGRIRMVEPAVETGSFRRAADEGVFARPGRPPERLTIGRERAIPSPSAAGQRHPAVAYGQGVYLLVWREGFSGADGTSEILAVRVNPEGGVLDEKPIEVSADAGIHDLPTVAFCKDNFLVAWSQRERTYDSGSRLQMRTIDPDGRLGTRTFRLSPAGAATHPALCSNGKDLFMLAWQEHNGEYYEVRGTRLKAAGGRPLDKPHLKIMSGSTSEHHRNLDWSRGGPVSLAWTGSGYVVGQSSYAVYLDPDGRTRIGLTRCWPTWDEGGTTAAAAWGKGFLFNSDRPNPDPWGWNGNGALVGMTLTAESARGERDALEAICGKDRRLQFVLAADGVLPNVLDASRWFNHPGWPMGMPGALKHSQGDVWPSGAPAAAHNGESLVVVWPRAHLSDTRRLRNRDLYLTRVLPGWGLVDRPPVAVSVGPTEEANPVLCAGSRGKALLAYETLTADGVVIRYRSITEEPDRRPPEVVYVSPKSRTEMVVAFDEPVAEQTVTASAFDIEGLEVKSARFVPGGRAMRRMVLLETTPPEIGREYTLTVDGVRDRSPAGNAVKGSAFKFMAKPGLIMRRDRVTRWATGGPVTETYANPCPVGHRDFIARWNVLAVLPRDISKHPFDPAKIRPSPGEKVKVGQTAFTWREIKGEAVELSGWFGSKADSMIYAATYVFSDRVREAMLRLDTNDHNRAWLNGMPINDGITAATGSRGSHDYSDEIPVTLRRGWNRLLIQVENRKGYWFLCGQITDRYGGPMHDLTWQLDRPDLEKE